MQSTMATSTGAQRLRLCCALALAAALAACATPGYYRLKVDYAPQQQLLGADSVLQQHLITVARFNDERGKTDAEALGRRVKSDGSELRALSWQGTPGEVAAAAVREAFFRNGYTLYGGMPQWDGAERTIETTWGSLVVGGFIDELDVVCATGFLSATYDTRVKLRVVFADAQRKKILYTRELESAASYHYFFFSRRRMERELSAALSLAIEKMFADNRIEEVLGEISHGRGGTTP